MNTLEKKHIAPYLPFDLKIKSEIGNVWEHKITKLSAFHFVYLNQIKPFLLPINSLIDSAFRKEFEEKFDYIGFDFEHYSSLIDCVSDSNILSFPYEMVEFLIERHFDVFGLIEQGLAIDVNTLKTDYNENSK